MVIKLRLLLLLVLPLLAILIGLESRPRDMCNYVAIGLLAGVMLLAPLSRLIGHFLILRDLKAVEQFCLRLKGGDYSVQFKLSPQQVDCVSHEACQRVKRFCKSAAKPFVMLRSSGVSALSRSIQKLEIEGHEVAGQT